MKTVANNQQCSIRTLLCPTSTCLPCLSVAPLPLLQACLSIFVYLTLLSRRFATSYEPLILKNKVIYSIKIEKE